MVKFIRKIFTLFLIISLAFIGYKLISKKEVVLVGHNSARLSSFPYYDILKGYNIEPFNFDPKSPGDYNLPDADGYIFMGGNDFDPATYGSNSYNLVEYYNRDEDLGELELLAYAIKNKKPVLGICRGMQLINIYYGGSLYEDIESQYGSDVVHRIDGGLSYHNINIEEGSSLYTYINTPSYEVNSYHHQAIRDLAEGLKPVAFSDDGLIEAIENPYYENFMLGLQWHPEFLRDDPLTREIFEDFVSSL